MSSSVKRHQKLALWNAMRLAPDDPLVALSAVKLALANGSDPTDGFGTWIPLGWAIRNQRLDIAHVLIQAGAHTDIVENGKHLITLCLLTPTMDVLAPTLITHGATPSGTILRVAAKRANEHVLFWAMDALIDPNDLSKHKLPAFNNWPTKIPPPKRLMEATFHRALSDTVATALIDLATRRKNKVLLEEIVRHSQISPAMKLHLLKGCLLACWREGVETLLAMRYVDPAELQGKGFSPLVACATWISRTSPRPGLEMLGKVLKYGYDINAARAPYAKENLLPTPDAFSLLSATSSQSRPALLAFLVEKGLRPIVSDGVRTKTLAHELIRSNEWKLLGDLSNFYPDILWDLPGSPGLLASWAVHHKDPGLGQSAQFDRPSNNPAKQVPTFLPEESLELVQALPGFDLQRRNDQGETGLRIFMKRPGGTHFSKVTTRLMEQGLNPFLKDATGVSDMEHMATLNLAPGLRATFEATALLLYSTQAASSSSSRRRL